MASQSTAPPAAAASPYTPEMLQYLVDDAADFNILSQPRPSGSRVAINGAGGAPIGFRIDEQLHRFSIVTHAPTEHRPMRAANTVGEVVGRFTHRWIMIPPDYVARPSA